MTARSVKRSSTRARAAAPRRDARAASAASRSNASASAAASFGGTTSPRRRHVRGRAAGHVGGDDGAAAGAPSRSVRGSPRLRGTADSRRGARATPRRRRVSAPPRDARVAAPGAERGLRDRLRVRGIGRAVKRELYRHAASLREPRRLDREVDALRPQHARHDGHLERRLRRQRRRCQRVGIDAGSADDDDALTSGSSPIRRGRRGSRTGIASPSSRARADGRGPRPGLRADQSCRAPRNPAREGEDAAAHARHRGGGAADQDGAQRDAVDESRASLRAVPRRATAA
jgi:hypothetical protein